MKLSKAEKKRRKLARGPTERQLFKKARGHSRKSLVAWAAEVRTAAGERCEVCGAGITQKFNKDGTPKMSRVKPGSNRKPHPIFTALNAHHILPKERYQEFKYVVANGICLCPNCHKYGKFSAHRNPLWFALWLRYNEPDKYAMAKAALGCTIETMYKPPEVPCHTNAPKNLTPSPSTTVPTQ